MAFFGVFFVFFGGGRGAFGNLGVHSAVGEGAGVEDKEVLGGGCGCLVGGGWGGGWWLIKEKEVLEMWFMVFE